MTAPEAAGKAAVLERMIVVIAGIVAACVMAYPRSSIHVRGIRMAVLVGEIAILFHGMGCAVDRCRSTRWNGLMVLMVSTAGLVGLPSLIVVLGKRRHCENKQCGQN
jgi:hypothetical protein